MAEANLIHGLFFAIVERRAAEPHPVKRLRDATRNPGDCLQVRRIGQASAGGGGEFACVSPQTGARALRGEAAGSSSRS